MNEVRMQQIIVSGLGGQGVLFVSRLLAETALDMGYSALLSETHGMAQRGGNVISHLKIWRPAPCGTVEPEGDGTREAERSHETTAGNAGKGEEAAGPCGTQPGFTSPLIRPGMADVFFSLHPDAILVHGHYLKPGGIAFRNTPQPDGTHSIDAAGIALKLGSPVSANLVLLGLAAASGELFCRADGIETTLKRLGGKRLEASLRAYRAGLNESVSTARQPGASSRG